MKGRAFLSGQQNDAQKRGPEPWEENGLAAAARSVFLDNDPTPEAVRFQMERLLGMAMHAGQRVGIGDPHRETLKCLRDFLDRLRIEVKKGSRLGTRRVFGAVAADWRKRTRGIEA